MNQVDSLMQRALGEGVFPGAVLLAARYEQIFIHRAYGVVDPFSRRDVECDTVYDLASLTKPLATAASLMHLASAGRIAAEDRLADIIPEFLGSDKSDIRIRHLLCHNSGLPAYRPYYLKLADSAPEDSRNELRKMLVAEDLLYPPGQVTVYSDPGFMILDWVVERKSGMPLDRYSEKFIYKPMGIPDLFFIPAESESGYDARVYAPTEQMSDGGLLRGRVHDENARAVGGVCGHAGLFGSARAVFDIVLALLLTVNDKSESTVFSGPVVRDFLKIPEGAQRAMGFDVPSGSDSSSGSYFTAGRSFGHLGFTGVSFWMDLDSGIIVVLLSNRVCPGRENEKIRTFRPVIHDAAVEYIYGGK
ncbi:MAG: serine hydrolase domain-containing protein [Desulfobacterales bacterium]